MTRGRLLGAVVCAALSVSACRGIVGLDGAYQEVDPDAAADSSANEGAAAEGGSTPEGSIDATADGASDAAFETSPEAAAETTAPDSPTEEAAAADGSTQDG